MLPLGTKAPAFALVDVVTSTPLTLASFEGRPALLVMFLCRHCPFVKHIEPELARLGDDYARRGVGILAISSNDAETYPEDAPMSLAEQAKAAGFGFAYGYDASQEVARAFHAACTPDFFLFDAERKLVYRGQLDDARPGNGKPNDGRDLRAALDALLEGRPVSTDQRPSVGCNIKWK
jgi:thiol-disulfide isomerase/thioredoxin